MDILFIFALLFLGGCFLFRKRLGIFLSDRRDSKRNPQELSVLPTHDSGKTVYKILAFNVNDLSGTKDLEDMVELRLERCLTGLSKQGYEAEVSLHVDGGILLFLIHYRY